MILLANLLIDPVHPDASADEAFSAKAIELFDRVVEFLPNPKGHAETRLIIAELHGRAVQTLSDARSEAELDSSAEVLPPNLLGFGGHDDDPWAWASGLPERFDMMPDSNLGRTDIAL